MALFLLLQLTTPFLNLDSELENGNLNESFCNAAVHADWSTISHTLDSHTGDTATLPASLLLRSVDRYNPKMTKENSSEKSNTQSYTFELFISKKA